MLYSTQKNITTDQPAVNADQVCAKFLTYPVTGGTKRQTEGGLRLQGKYKRSFADKPLISVVTVVYNMVGSVEKTILSVLEQQYDNIEYIIIDGGSTDGTVGVINKYAEAIDYFVSEPDGGIYPAMNRGLALASGDYINMMNADDRFFDPTAINRVVKRINKTGCRLIVGNSILLMPDGKQKIREIALDYRSANQSMPLTHNALFIHRAVHAEFGNYDTQFKIVSDYDLFLRIYLAGEKFVHLPEVIIYFDHTGSGVSSNPLYNSNMVNETQEVVLKNNPRHILESYTKIKEDKWYRFGQKRFLGKVWLICAWLSKKTGMYRFLKPIISAIRKKI